MLEEHSRDEGLAWEVFLQVKLVHEARKEFGNPLIVVLKR